MRANWLRWVVHNLRCGCQSEGGDRLFGFHMDPVYLHPRLVDEARGRRSIWHATCDRLIDRHRLNARLSQREFSFLQ